MNRTLCALFAPLVVVILSMALAAPNLYAIDSNKRCFAYGLGERSCAEYVKIREKNIEQLERQDRLTKGELYEIVDKIVEHWIAGFLTATNLLMADTYDVAGNTSMGDLKDRLEKICRADEKQRVAQAMARLLEQLTPRRLNADPQK
jgi:hypothetical protein